MAWHPAGLVCILEAADDLHDDDDDAPLLRLPLTSRRSCSPTQEIILIIIIRDRIDQGMHEEKPLPAVCAEPWQTDVVSSTAAGLFSPIICNSVLLTAMKHDSDDE
jgi:hypothetical protein